MTRKYSIDILRIISAFAVIVIHVVSAPVSNSTVPVVETLAANLELIHTLINWSVPVFFMITGYCVLQKQECTYEYCFAHVWKYTAVLFTVGLFYSLLEAVFYAGTVNIPILLQSVKNVITGNIWDHMWFVYSIIGIYLVLPVIHLFMQQGQKNSIILTSLLFFFTILCPSIDDRLSINVDFPFGGYLFYVCFGGIAAKCIINKQQRILFYLAGALSVVWIISNYNSHVGYRHPAVCLTAMSVFLLVSNQKVKPSPHIRRISECTWGIYLIHPFFINITLKVLKLDLLSSMPYMSLFVFTIVITLVSLITVYLLRKIPLVNKLF